MTINTTTITAVFSNQGEIEDEGDNQVQLKK